MERVERNLSRAIDVVLSRDEATQMLSETGEILKNFELLREASDFGEY